VLGQTEGARQSFINEKTVFCSSSDVLMELVAYGLGRGNGEEIVQLHGMVHHHVERD